MRRLTDVFRRVRYSANREGIAIWYLLSCRAQEERKTLESCKDFFSNAALLDAFVLTYDRMCRYHGTWHMEKKLIFPSNVLLESKNETALRAELNQHKGVEGAVGQIWTILQMNPEEEKFLKFLCGTKKHIGMSRGVIRKGVTKVTEGPLKGLEAQIYKIDRHKRLARLRTPTGENMRYIPAGLEIVEKSI